jgi:DNA-binding response OmpR family regulator
MSRKPRQRVRGATILVIAYGYILRDILTRFLKSRGHTVVSRSLGCRGLRAFERGKGKFDLVMIDRGLPDMSGVGVAWKIKEMSKDTPVLLLKGRDKGPVVEESVSKGVDFIVSKPLYMDMTLRLVENILEREAR